MLPFWSWWFGSVLPDLPGQSSLTTRSWSLFWYFFVCEWKPSLCLEMICWEKVIVSVQQAWILEVFYEARQQLKWWLFLKYPCPRACCEAIMTCFAFFIEAAWVVFYFRNIWGRRFCTRSTGPRWSECLVWIFYPKDRHFMGIECILLLIIVKNTTVFVYASGFVSTPYLCRPCTFPSLATIAFRPQRAAS